MATTITTSTFAQALVRAGARSLVKRNGGNLLLLLYDGTNAKSREGVDLAGLASATAVTIVAMGSSSDGAWGHLMGNAAISAVEQFVGYHNAAGGPVRYSYAAGAWTSRTVAQGNAFQSAHGLIYDATHYWFQIGYHASDAASGTAAPTWISQYGTDEAYVVTAWNGKYLAVRWGSGGTLWYQDSDSITATTGVNFPSDTSLETGLTATATFDNNAAITTDSNGNAWLLYKDNSGMACRYRPAAGGAWSAKTRVTSQTSDKSPAIMRDTSGNVWMAWIDGASGNAIMAQKATISGGAISLTGSAQTLETTAGTPTRNYLHVVEEDNSTLTYVWVEGSGSPWTIKGNTFSISGGGSVAISGTMSAGATLSDTLDVAHSLSGTAAAGASLSDVLGVTHSLAGTMSAGASLTGAIDHTVPLSGTGAAGASLADTLDVAHALTGTAAASATLAGILDHGVPLGGAMSAGASMAASIGGVALSGQANAGASMTAGLSVTVNLSGQLAGGATLADTLDHTVPLSGSAQAAASLTPALAHGVPVGGQMSAASSLTSALAHVVPLGGLAAALASLVGSLAIIGQNSYGSMTLGDRAVNGSATLADRELNDAELADRAVNSLTLTEA